MPVHEIALPVGAKNITPNAGVIYRPSKDGDIPIVRLFGGDNFIGEALEGHWKTNRESNTQEMTIIQASGQIDFKGRAEVSGTNKQSWANSQAPFLMIQDSYLDVHLKVTTTTPSYATFFYFLLIANASDTTPNLDDNFLEVRLCRTTTPSYTLQVRKEINGVPTTIYTATAVTNEEGTMRFKFRPDDDELDIYYHDGSGDIVESTDELTLNDDTLDLAFDIGYPAFQFATRDTTAFTHLSERVEVSYPDISIPISYDLSVDAQRGQGIDVLLTAKDTVGSNDGTLVGPYWSKDGKFDRSLLFDGIDDYVSIASETYDLSKVTFCFWAKRNLLRASFPDTFLTVFGDTVSTHRQIGFDWSGEIRLESDTDSDIAAGTFTDDLEWHHYALSWLNDNVKFYEDGVDVTSNNSISDDITLSKIGIAGTARAMDGYIDDVRIYDDDLSQAEVQAVMADNPKAADMTSEWLFDGGDTRGDVSCYDTMGSATESDWSRVYSEDHNFIGNCVIENGLVRLYIDDSVENGLMLYYWNGKEWSQPLDTIKVYQDVDIKDFSYPFFKQLIQIDKAERLELRIRLCDSVTESNSYYTDLYITLRRGMHHVRFTIDGVLPAQPIRFIYGDATYLRWAFCGDADTEGVGDYDLTLTVTNNTLTDNFMMKFDDAGQTVIGYMATNEKPAAGSTAFESSGGEELSLRSIAIADFEDTEVYVGLTPYPHVSSLFVEGESATHNGTNVVDATCSNGMMVELDAQDEYTYHLLTGINEISVGRYRFIARLKDTNQIADDVEMWVYNQDDSEYINVERDIVTFTATSGYTFYSIVFYVSDVDSGDALRFYVNKGTGTANTLKVDYLLIVPISDGRSLVQDIAHNEMRKLDQGWRLTDTASYELFAGSRFGFGRYFESAYTDAMAVAAIEREATLDLTGVLTCKDIKNSADTDGFYVGAGDDLRIHHDGTNTYLTNTEGDLIFENVGGDIRLETQEFFLDVTGKVQFRDADDSDVVLFELDSTARTFKIGTVTDFLTVTFVGDIALSGGDITVTPTTGTTAYVVEAGDLDINIWEVIRGGVSEYGYYMKYVGTGSGDENYLELWSHNQTDADELLMRWHQSTQETEVAGALTLSSIVAGISDYDKFLVSDNGIVKFRTGAEVLADIGAASVPLALTDLASYVQGSIIIGGGVDWEVLGAGTEDYILKMGVAEPAWGQVDYSELAGTQPAPVAHVLASASHTVSGLTAGDILSADTATTYSWKVNPAATVPLALTDLASYAQGSLIIGGGADWEALAKGTNTQVLTSDGTDISWEDAASGGPGTGTQWDLPVWDTTSSLGDSMVSQDSGGTALTIGGSATINTIAVEATDIDKFLVANTGLIKSRTGAQVLSDIDGMPKGQHVFFISLVGFKFSGVSGQAGTSWGGGNIRYLVDVAKTIDIQYPLGSFVPYKANGQTVTLDYVTFWCYDSNPNASLLSVTCYDANRPTHNDTYKYTATSSTRTDQGNSVYTVTVSPSGTGWDPMVDELYYSILWGGSSNTTGQHRPYCLEVAITIN